MSTAAKAWYNEEEMTRMDIREFINEGLKDVKDGNLLEMDEVFNELEQRYAKL